MGEEGLLNIFFYKKWHKLPNIYNLFVDKNENYWKINPLKVHTIIIHSIGSMKPWDRKSILYDEWQNIAQKADKISLNRRISKKEWSKFKIFFYASFLEIKGFFLRKDIYEWQFDLFYYAVMDIVMLRFPKFFKLLKKTKARIKKFNNV
jgi:lipopolysaccharide biosynthesis glycosyltransferase